VRAQRTSKRLDDHARDYAGRASIDSVTLAEQECVDAALSDRSGVPWVPPSPNLRHGILRSIQHKRYNQRRKEGGPQYPHVITLAVTVSCGLFVASPAGGLLLAPFHRSAALMIAPIFATEEVAVRVALPAARPSFPAGEHAVSTDMIAAEFEALREDAARAARALMPPTE
jgi:hypothetical protein